MDDGDPQQRLDVHVVWLRLKRIPEEDDDVDAALDDRRARRRWSPPSGPLANRVTGSPSAALSRAPVVPVACRS